MLFVWKCVCNHRNSPLSTVSPPHTSETLPDSAVAQHCNIRDVRLRTVWMGSTDTRVLGLRAQVKNVAPRRSRWALLQAWDCWLNISDFIWDLFGPTWPGQDVRLRFSSNCDSVMSFSDATDCVSWPVRDESNSSTLSAGVLSFRTLHRGQTWSRSCVQLPAWTNWWVSSIRHTGPLWSADPNFLPPLPRQPPSWLSGHSLAAWGLWVTQRSQHLPLPTSIWTSWKVCLLFFFF